ncbi:MAG: phosphoesterase [Campylobacterota bacterium]|nr:phosphoesterase [Campylobacterota bacterium]
MNDIFEKISSAKYVVIVVKEESLLPSASALYSHILRLHKKVSLVCEKNIVDKKFSFLPWFEKIRETLPSSADLVIELDTRAYQLYSFFKSNNIKPNQKMATALYASMLVEYDGFVGGDADGMVFATASELMACGADYKLCNKFIIKRTTLATFRLKSLMLKNMLLQENATKAVFSICDDDLKSTGTTLKDAKSIIKEVLGLEYVEVVVLIKSDENDKILKIIDKEI